MLVTDEALDVDKIWNRLVRLVAVAPGACTPVLSAAKAAATAAGLTESQ